MLSVGRIHFLSAWFLVTRMCWHAYGSITFHMSLIKKRLLLLFAVKCNNNSNDNNNNNNDSIVGLLTCDLSIKYYYLFIIILSSCHYSSLG